MSNLIRTIIFLVLSIVIVVVGWVVPGARIFKEPWLNYLWANFSYLLHQEWFAVPLVALIYLTAFLFVRWHLIAWPIRLDLLAVIADLKLQLDLEVLDSPAKKGKIDAMREALCGAARRLNQIGALDRILWTRGQEEAAWSQVDDVECELAVLQSFGRVRARLELSEQELREIPTKDAGALADLVHGELARCASEAGDSCDNRFRSLLYEALGVINAHDANDLDDTMNWHNKALWLTCVGVLLLISLEGARRGGGGLFAAGAADGFLSRLMRAIKQVDDPADSSAYWTTLSLSPLVGALAGWTGILLIELAFRLGVLGAAFGGVSMETGYASFALALAFLLGFSERLFDAIAGSVEEKAAKKAEAKGASSLDSRPPRTSPSPLVQSSSSESSRSDPAGSGGSLSSNSG
jgi:hypothetical protein